MNDVMQWFIRLVKKDMASFEVDEDDEKEMLKIILQRLKDG